jgi:hypothetical protein
VGSSTIKFNKHIGAHKNSFVVPVDTSIQNAMKIYGHLLALCFYANVCGTAAFSMKATKAAGVLRSSISDDEPATQTEGAAGRVNNVSEAASPASDKMMMTPTFQMERIEGGGRVQTYNMPNWADRCQMIFSTTGRPLKANVELMLGPTRTTHQLKLDIEDGRLTPYQATLKFKKNQQVLRITSRESEYPILFGLLVPPPELAEELEANTEKVWASTDQKARIQGGSVGGAGGAREYWTIPPNVKSVQVLVWTKDVGKKSLKVTINVFQGADNVKQKIFLQCGGGSQPYHAVVQTPAGGVIGVTNEKFMEDGLMEIAFVPYEMN